MESKPFEEFTNENGLVRIWKTPDGTPMWLEIRKPNKQAGYIKLGEPVDANTAKKFNKDN